ncbi:Ribosomal RNA small subunit methyltransferase E [Caulifigura coniformis]|uniref:Ribosomal RNA small subunit methyltransferase E n=1 Tax=Caulifigura coniformis TaxID=2527983 RepID=A0A517S9P8_9PLAN|nr:RsmE family RNA methyltransferase [Caulifigura coniformis]QDT52843.1 Ribosomal RNA small subunit methyltransferase E [Caulifigura coniformis]
MDRFFCPTLSDGTTVTLTDEEFHHLAHVLRGKPGQQVELFDGQGRSVDAVVEKLNKRDAQLSLIGPHRQDSGARVSLVLGVACPKGDRLKWLVEKATELGVAEFVPLQCERSVVEPRETKLAKLEQTVLSACKQCRRNSLMRIGEPQALSDFLKKGPSWIAHPGGDPAGALVSSMSGTGSEFLTVRAAIGPEGGFTDAEVQEAVDRGGRLVSLGKNVLRVETAAVAFAALAAAAAGD